MIKTETLTSMLPGMDLETRMPGKSYGEKVMDEVNSILDKLAIQRLMQTRLTLKLHPMAFPTV